MLIPEFSWLPPEINSARIFAGAGSGPLFVAAAGWEALAAELQAAMSSFQSVISGLVSGPWSGPTSLTMAAAATPYVGWLSAASAQAEQAAGQARAAASAFEAALTATVHPAAVAANRVSLLSLIATNFLGQNTPAIAGTEFDYAEMWAQDVAAMLGYNAGAASVASALTPFTIPLDLAGLNLSGLASTATAAVSGAVTAVQSAASALPVQSLMSVAQIAMYPASMMMSPMMQLATSANSSTAGLAGSAAAGLADVPKFVGDIAPAAKGLGGGGLGAGMSAALGQGRMVGAMSVPPTWAGSTPAGMASSAVRGLGSVIPPAPELAAAAPTGSGMPMMPMPMGAGAGAGMPGPMMGRGGAGSNVVQSRPSVIPRTGVG